MFERIRKWLALRSYRSNLGHLLVERYGRERYYTPAQVLTTIKLHRFSEHYAAYACVMFCSKRSYENFAAATLPTRDSTVAPLAEPNIPIWADTYVMDWPAHSEIVAELNHRYGPASHGDFGADHHSASFGDHYDAAATLHHDGAAHGGYDGGGHHGSGYGGGHGSH